MIELASISWQAGAFRLEDLSWRIPERSYAILMGPTGCGKTTLLEIICGLRRPRRGRILLDGRDVTHAQPGARGIGYVPQDGALFPSMIVREQLGFALLLRRRPRAEIAARVAELAGELGIEPLLERRPAGLSGGERQRVALGRALAAQPRLLLLDEPLSALDEERRGELAMLLKRMQQRHGLTVLHITHSAQEAAQLADVFFRFEAGRIVETPLPGDRLPP
jgi:ABC-type sugar transport system ATPase subunit